LLTFAALVYILHSDTCHIGAIAQLACSQKLLWSAPLIERLQRSCRDCSDLLCM